jgi:hypothetical protein
MIVVNRDYYLGSAAPGYTPLVYPHPLIAADTGVTATGSGKRGQLFRLSSP